MGDPRFIKLSKYLRHRAVWETTGQNEYGDTSITTSQTVLCYYYQGSVYREFGNQVAGASRAVQNLELEHLALLYSSVTVKINDRLKTITTFDNEALLAEGRVVRVERFHGWDNGRGLMLQQVTLEFN